MRVVPGLLQTEDYARAVISAGKPRDTSAAIGRAVGARLERQAILQRENPWSAAPRSCASSSTSWPNWPASLAW
jgi:Domain of unknown function (DUF5753)